MKKKIKKTTHESIQIIKYSDANLNGKQKKSNFKNKTSV